MNTQFTAIIQEQRLKDLQGKEGERIVQRFILWPRRDVHGVLWLWEKVWCYEEFQVGYIGHGMMSGSGWHRVLLGKNQPKGLEAYMAVRKNRVGLQTAIDHELGNLKADPTELAEELLQKMQPWSEGPEYTVGPVDYKTSW